MNNSLFSYLLVFSAVGVAGFLWAMDGSQKQGMYAHIASSEISSAVKSVAADHLDTNIINPEDYYNSSNELVVEKGLVTVVRKNGEREEVTSKTSVEAGDKIIVSDGGLGSIHFFDDSISRIRGGSEIVIEEANYDPQNIATTNITLKAIRGEIWSKVNSLIDTDSEFSVKGNGVVAGVRGSAFNFVTEEDEVFIESIQHAVFLEQKGKQIILTEGKGAEVSYEEAILFNLSEEHSDEWHQENIQKDEYFDERIQEKNKQRLRKISQNTEALRKGTPLERKIKETELEIAERLFSLYEEKGDKEDILELQKEIEITEGYIERSQISSGEKERLKRNMKSLVQSSDRMLAEVLPDTPELYEAKQTIRAKHVSMEKDGEKRKQMEEKFQERELYDISDLSKKSNIDEDIIEKRLKKYLQKRDQKQRSEELEEIEKHFLEKLQKEKYDKREENVSENEEIKESSPQEYFLEKQAKKRNMPVQKKEERSFPEQTFSENHYSAPEVKSTSDVPAESGEKVIEEVTALTKEKAKWVSPQSVTPDIAKEKRDSKSDKEKTPEKNEEKNTSEVFQGKPLFDLKKKMNEVRNEVSVENIKKEVERREKVKALRSENEKHEKTRRIVPLSEVLPQKNEGDKEKSNSFQNEKRDKTKDKNGNGKSEDKGNVSNASDSGSQNAQEKAADSKTSKTEVTSDQKNDSASNQKKEKSPNEASVRKGDNRSDTAEKSEKKDSPKANPSDEKRLKK